MPSQTISVIGLGYIGLPTAAVVSECGYDVIGVDVNEATVETINSGGVHIFEPGLEAVVHSNVSRGTFKATLTPQPSDIFLIAVPTPFFADNKKANLRYVEQAARDIAPVLRPGNLVVLESTSPLGTTLLLSQIMAEMRPDLSFPHDNAVDPQIMVAYCPERVLPGKVLHELRNNDRIIGGLTPSCSDAAKAFYQTITNGHCLKSNAATAELSKLTENAFRDVNVAFANELSMICDRLDIDVWQLIDLVNFHPRVNVLRPGAGVGGHCIAVDPWFIVQSAPEESTLIRAARHVNDEKPNWVLQKIEENMRARALDSPSKIACFGLAFKPNIDDLRESPALDVVTRLANTTSNEICVVEPFISELPEQLRSKKCTLMSATEALEQADLAVFLVRHSSFGGLEVPSNVDIIDVCGSFQTSEI